MGATAFPHNICSPQHLHMRDAIVACFIFPVVRGDEDTCCRFLFPVLLHHRSIA